MYILVLIVLLFVITCHEEKKINKVHDRFNADVHTNLMFTVSQVSFTNTRENIPLVYCFPFSHSMLSPITHIFISIRADGMPWNPNVYVCVLAKSATICILSLLNAKRVTHPESVSNWENKITNHFQYCNCHFISVCSEKKAILKLSFSPCTIY